MLSVIQISLIAAGIAGIFPLFFKRWSTISKYVSFLFLGISGIGAVWAGIMALLGNENILYQINSGFLGVIWQFKIDPLAGFFLIIIGIIVTSVAVYGPSYIREYEKRGSIVGIALFTNMFILGMYFVVLAVDVFSFMLSWELMSIASYFLVVYQHENAANRSAAFVYLLMAHLSGLLILMGYGILIKFGDGFSFTALAASNVSSFWASAAFLSAFLGFGMKAGIVPLHVWLPRAHPVAPSHISALMSGVMLKVAVYGFLRFSFTLLKNMHWQWGVLVLIMGTISALVGVLYALMQHDLKKLLAYHSVENIGIIFMGIGLAIIFISTGHPVLGALGLIAALYHCLNHALFKSLLFLGAGAILQQSHESDLEKMGGLIHKMPYTALFFLIGCMSISALPPFNGFVSEWLTFQTALQAMTLKSGTLRTLIPVTGALLALTSALAAACFVKVYGVAFLGQARTKHVFDSCDSAFGMRLSMGLLALLCLIFGVLAASVINVINVIPTGLIGVGLPTTHNWLWLIPLSASTASYSAPLVLVIILVMIFGSYWLINLCFKKTKVRSVNPWECGFGKINAGMQYSATAFSMPIRRSFKGIWSVVEKVDKNDSIITYDLKISDWTWIYLYEPLETYLAKISRNISKIQGGNVRVYLAYVFFTLILLLWVIV